MVARTAALLSGALLVLGCGTDAAEPGPPLTINLHTPPDRQGEILGIGQSGLSLARILGPYAGMSLFAVSPETPYWVSAAVMLLAVGGALFLRPISR